VLILVPLGHQPHEGKGERARGTCHGGEGWKEKKGKKEFRYSNESPVHSTLREGEKNLRREGEGEEKKEKKKWNRLAADLSRLNFQQRKKSERGRREVKEKGKRKRKERSMKPVSGIIRSLLARGRKKKSDEGRSIKRDQRKKGKKKEKRKKTARFLKMNSRMEQCPQGRKKKRREGSSCKRGKPGGGKKKGWQIFRS